MEQDLFVWLNSQRDSQNTGLLVAPLLPERQEEISAYTPESGQADTETLPELHTETQTPGSGHASSESHGEILPYIPEPEEDAAEPLHENQPSATETGMTESGNDLGTYDSESLEDKQPDNVPESTQPCADTDAEIPPCSPGQEDAAQESEPQSTSSGNYEDSYIPLPPDSYIPEEYMPSAEIHDDDYAPVPQNHEWQERATGFTLSLDEPPPELWTHINDDDPDPEYEPTDSLQGAAYVQIHGRNFTERLHHTLKHRKERAEERAQSEHEPDPLSPLRQIAVILAGTLVMAVGFACLALWFVGRETPDGMKSRAQSLTEQGKYDEASAIYQRAYRRYPNDPEILAGLSSSAEKAGHPQTAKAAHDEYSKTFSETASKDSETSPENEAGKKPEPKKEIIIPIRNKKPSAFHDYLTAGNHAYNIGMYSKAALNFFRAVEINSRDIRAYIGLANAYRMKGMYFDSRRILDEARRLFGGSPAIDMSLHFLREDIKGR